MIFPANEATGKSSFGGISGEFDETITGTFISRVPKAGIDMNGSSTTLVTFGCAAAIALALVGAAYAVDAPKKPPVELAPRGDLIAVADMSAYAGAVTVEEVNLDAGISNLVLIRTEPAPM